MMIVKTEIPKAKEWKREWHLVDVGGKVLGRVATEIVAMLMGKKKVNYAPNVDMGDRVVVINANQVVLTGKKESGKVYRRHSQYPGGMKELRAAELRRKRPGKMIELAVKGMLPDNRLRKRRMARLTVFGGSEHPYENQLK